MDIKCFCGGELVKGRTVAWDCASCGEQWWPHLWDKLQLQRRGNKALQAEIADLNKVIEIFSINWLELKKWSYDSTPEDIPVKWILEKMARLEELNGEKP